jgi:hypothetical protein
MRKKNNQQDNEEEEQKDSNLIDMEGGFEDVNEGEDGDAVIDLDEDDIADFSKMGLGGISKKIKKKKGGNNMVEEKDFIPLKNKKNKGKNAKGGVKKSKKIMKW